MKAVFTCDAKPIPRLVWLMMYGQTKRSCPFVPQQPRLTVSEAREQRGKSTTCFLLHYFLLGGGRVPEWLDQAKYVQKPE